MELAGSWWGNPEHDAMKGLEGAGEPSGALARRARHHRYVAELQREYQKHEIGFAEVSATQQIRIDVACALGPRTHAWIATIP
jgi:hypothetical protein